MKRALMFILPPLVLLGGAGAAVLLVATRPQPAPQPREAPAPMVRVLQTREQDYQLKVRTQGTVRPRSEISLSPEVSGVVVFVSDAFASGGFFEAGEALFRVDPRDYELAVTRAQAAYAEAQVRVAREEAETEIARREWESLGRGGAANPLLLREPQLAEARAALASAGAALEQAKRDLERCEVRAPFAGRVLEKNVDVGQFVTRGSLAARIYSVDYAEVRLPVALDQLAYLDLPFDYRGEGRPQSLPAVELLARFGTETFRWQGTVVRTEGEVDARSRMLHAVARIEQPYGREANSNRPPLAAGLFVEAMIEGRRVSGVHVLPREALRGRDRVYVVQDGKLNIRPVQVLRAERQVAVISEGLEDGEWVCISPLEMAVEGMPVRVAENGGPALNQTALNHQIAQQLP